MRTLYFLEPVIFQNSPEFFAYHFIWVNYFSEAAARSGGSLMLLANGEVCDEWTKRSIHLHRNDLCRSVDSFRVMEDFEFRRPIYARRVYGGSGEECFLFREVRAAALEFQPDLVVMSSQNAIARLAVGQTPVLSVEQAPLPRLGHPFRTFLDPCGHQTGSVIEIHGERIRNLLKDDGTRRRQALKLLDALKTRLLWPSSVSARAASALKKLAAGNKVALLATQPPDAVTYEGAYEDIELENLLFKWAEGLPEGWIGVPTYHSGHSLSLQMERALASSTRRLRFLPQPYSQNLTEALLLEADGLVTISSSSAMAALLFGKRVIVTGRSPLSSWCAADPAALSSARPLERAEIASTLCFLTNRYCFTDYHLIMNAQIIDDLLEAYRSASYSPEWLFDVSEWTPESARLLFNLEVGADGAALRQARAIESLQERISDLDSELDVTRKELQISIQNKETLNERLIKAEAERNYYRTLASGT